MQERILQAAPAYIVFIEIVIAGAPSPAWEIVSDFLWKK
jgi:hypothetical protein